MDDLISRQEAISHFRRTIETCSLDGDYNEGFVDGIEFCLNFIGILPSSQSDCIPLEWIDKHLEWLDNCDNDFAQLARVSIRAMVEIWKKDKTR